MAILYERNEKTNILVDVRPYSIKFSIESRG